MIVDGQQFFILFCMNAKYMIKDIYRYVISILIIGYIDYIKSQVSNVRNFFKEMRDFYQKKISKLTKKENQFKDFLYINVML